MKEDYISGVPKDQYKKEIKHLNNTAAFNNFMGLKETHKKIDQIKYEEFRIQPYLKSKVVSQKKKKLLYLLRSQCHNSKYNFKKLNRNNLNCRFGCPEVEDQIHTFTKFPYLFSDYLNKPKTLYENIFGNINEQELLMYSYI